MEKALRSTLRSASGQAKTMLAGEPDAPEPPRNGSVCSNMMITPMPDMNPDITEYGV